MYNEPVRLNTLQTWRGSAPEDFTYVPTAWQWLTVDWLDVKGPIPNEFPRKEIGLLQDTPANAYFWDETAAQATAVGAKYLLLKTPTTFSPAAQHVDALRRLALEKAAPLGIQLVWEPRGVWTQAEKQALADELGMLIATDPWGEDEFPPPPAGTAYYVLTGPRNRRDFSREDFVDLLEWLATHGDQDVYLAVRGADRERNARALMKVIEEEWTEIQSFVAEGGLADGDDTDDDDDAEYEEYEEYDDDADGEGDDDDADGADEEGDDEDEDED